MEISLRAAQPQDQELLFLVYSSTRQHEVAAFGWAPEQQETFLRMQFNAQQRSYDMSYSGADHWIIVVNEKPAGRMIVARDQDSATLVDISLLPDYRNQGIGGRLIQDLLAHSASQKLRVKLQALKSNPALRLYRRLGFTPTGEDAIYIQMEKSAS